MLMALTWYSLADHVLSDDAFTDDPTWTRIDAVVLSWLTNTITADLQEVVREHGHLACHLWLTLENQFLGNYETHTLHLDAAFHNFVHGDLSMTEYCHKFKGMADALIDLGIPVDDWILILNILCGMNQCFEHLEAIIRCSSLFSNFLKVHDDLLLEEIHQDTAGLSAAPTTLYTSTVPPAPSLLRHPDRPTATTTAAMVVTTAARTTIVVAVVVVTLATPPRPPLAPPATTAWPPQLGQRTSTHGRGTSPCTPARYPQDNSTRRPS
jgi:hypothetical protein